MFAKDRALQSETVAKEQRLDERETQVKPVYLRRQPLSQHFKPHCQLTV